jgi:hypothetical protein
MEAIFTKIVLSGVDAGWNVDGAWELGNDFRGNTVQSRRTKTE